MAATPRPEMLVDAAWLQAHLEDADLRVVDCDSAEAYRRAHIPGAVNPRDNRFKDPDNARFVMRPRQFAAAMAELGIGPETQVIAYDATGALNAGRLWWCLKYYGHDNVRIADGGWNRWLAEGGAISMSATRPSAAPFVPKARPERHASAE